MRVHSSLQKYENEDTVMCNYLFSPRIFVFSLLQGAVISFEGCYLSSKGRQIYASEIYNLIFHRFLSGIHRNLYRKSTEKAVEAVGNDVSLNH